MKNIEIYDESGKVKDTDVAEVMAHTEKPFREKKRLGIFRPSKKTIEEGERLAEEAGLKYAEEKQRQEENEKAIDIKRPEIEVAVAVGKHKVFFSHLEDYEAWEKNHPGVEILTEEEGKKITVQEMPSFARMEEIDPNEEVHLTESAAFERLEVLLHTSPQFSKKPSIVMEEIKEHPVAPIFSESNKREPADAQTAIRELEKLGFSFIERGGSFFMLVDSVIPAAKNTDGRMYKQNLGTYRDKRFQDNFMGTDYVELTGSGMLPSSPGKIGIQGIKNKTERCFAIPVDKILDFHFTKPGIGYSYFGRNQADNYNLGELHEDRDGCTIIQIIARVFNELRNEVKDNEELKPLFDSFNIINQKRKEILFKILTERVGLKPFSGHHSFFPKEPSFPFNLNFKRKQLNEMLGSEEQLNENILGEIYPDKNNRHLPSTHLYLEDILTIIKSYC